MKSHNRFTVKKRIAPGYSYPRWWIYDNNSSQWVLSQDTLKSARALAKRWNTEDSPEQRRANFVLINGGAA